MFVLLNDGNVMAKDVEIKLIILWYTMCVRLVDTVNENFDSKRTKQTILQFLHVVMAEKKTAKNI